LKKGKTIGIILASSLIGASVATGSGYLYLKENGGLTQNISQLNNNQSSSNSKISPVTIKGQSSSTKVYNALKESVVSVINEQVKSSKSDSDSDLNDFWDQFGGQGKDESGSSSKSESSKEKSDSSSSSTEEEYEEVGSGSGVIYKSEDGNAYIVTNNHVVDGANKLQVVLFDGKKIDAKLVGKDAMTDLAVIKIDSKNVKSVAEFGKSSQIQVGQQVVAIGSPLGDEFSSTLTEGIVSANNRLVSNIGEDGTNYGQAIAIQTDAAINPGNSGGALVNMNGQVIGITSQKLTQTESGVSVEGMGFAIPSDTVVNIINKLVKDGKVIRPALGVSIIDLSDVDDEDREKTLKIPTDIKSGIVVAAFSNDDSPAKKAGLKKYDVIVGIDGKKVKTSAELKDALYKHKMNDTVKLTYYRGETQKTASIKLTQELK
jgi:serine protease Do